VLFTEQSQCPAGQGALEVDVLSDNRVGILLGAVVGSVGIMAFFLFIAAYLMRHPPVDGLLAGSFASTGVEFANNSAIYTPGGTEVSNPVFVDK